MHCLLLSATAGTCTLACGPDCDLVTCGRYSEQQVASSAHLNNTQFSNFSSVFHDGLTRRRVKKTPFWRKEEEPSKDGGKLMNLHAIIIAKFKT